MRLARACWLWIYGFFRLFKCIQYEGGFTGGAQNAGSAGRRSLLCTYVLLASSMVMTGRIHRWIELRTCLDATTS